MIKERIKALQSSITKNNEQKIQKFESANIDTRLSKVRKSTKSIKNSKKSISVSKKKKCNDGCRKHQFQLKPIGYSSFLSKSITEPVTVNFCSKGNSTTIPIPIIPMQLSKEPQVPLFILDEEIYRYEYYVDSHREQFKDAINKANKNMNLDQEQNMLRAIPKTKNCQICKVKIDTQQEYEKHIDKIQHKLAIRKSLGQKYINEEAQDFKQELIYANELENTISSMNQLSKIFKEAKRMLKGIIKRK